MRVAKKVVIKEPTSAMNSPVQFFLAPGAKEPLGTIEIKDRRLDRALFAALGTVQGFLWDEELNGYVVDLSTANPPHLVRPQPAAGPQVAELRARIAAQGAPPAGATPAPASPASAGATGAAAPRPTPTSQELTADPHWRGSETGYTSRAGWRLDLVRERVGLPKAARGKQWRLTHPMSAAEVWYKSKRDATAAIRDGHAARDLGGGND
jgi:hypothetical protein